MIGTQNYCGYVIFRVIPDFEFQVGVPASARFVRGKESEYTHISRVSGQWIHLGGTCNRSGTYDLLYKCYRSGEFLARADQISKTPQFVLPYGVCCLVVEHLAIASRVHRSTLG